MLEVYISADLSPQMDVSAVPTPIHGDHSRVAFSLPQSPHHIGRALMQVGSSFNNN